MTIPKKLLTLILVGSACVTLDQTTKIFAATYLPRHVMRTYLFDILRIGYSENTGGFLGIGNALPSAVRFWIFTVAVGVFLMLLLYYLITDIEHRLGSVIGLSLVVSGGASNLYDRIINQGSVVDFLNLGIGPLRTGVFNLADVAIFGGIAIALYSQSRHKT